VVPVLNALPRRLREEVHRWLVHLVISASIGASFGLLLGGLATAPARAIGLGVGYGGVWWVPASLLIMPAWLGMGAFTFNTAAWMSLVGHLIYGLLLGVVYALVQRAPVVPLARHAPTVSSRATDRARAYCSVEGLTALGRPPWGSRPPPWAPGRRGEAASVDLAAAAGDSTPPPTGIGG
jgi:hypothetical protein